MRLKEGLLTLLLASFILLQISILALGTNEAIIMMPFSDVSTTLLTFTLQKKTLLRKNLKISLIPLSNQLHSLFPLFLMTNKKNKFSLLKKQVLALRQNTPPITVGKGPQVMSWRGTRLRESEAVLGMSPGSETLCEDLSEANQ